MAARRPLAAVPDAPFRAVGLVRVSKERAGMISPELQRTAIEDSVATRGGIVVGWIEGPDESGSQERSRWWRKLEQAVALVEAGDVDELCVWKFSRAARHRRRWAVAIDRVEVAGGRLTSATEQIDTATSTGRLARGVLAELAAWEAEVKGEQWREVHARRRRMGLPHGGFPRIGYRYDKANGYTVDPDTAPIAVECFRRYLAGDGCEKIADYLASQGVASPRSGKRWTGRGVRSWMDSGHHAGLLHVGGGYQPGAHEPVIDEATWAAYLRERRRRLDVPPRLRNPTTAGAGLTRCSGCGLGMRVHHDTRYGRAYMYACTTRGCPAPVQITRRRVEAALLDWLAALAGDVDAHAAARSAQRAGDAVARATKTRLARAAVRAEEALNRLTVDLASGRIRAAQYDAAREHFDALRAQLQRDIDAADASMGPVVPRSVIRGLLAEWDAMSVEGRARLLRALVARIEVTREQGRRPTVRIFARWE